MIRPRRRGPTSRLHFHPFPLQGYWLLIGHHGSERHERLSEVSSVETFYVPITLISTPVWILSSRVQLSESTSARVRILELLD